MDLTKHIRTIPDFPKQGILFYDIGTLLAHPQAWKAAIEQIYEKIAPYKPDMLVGIESRGFLLAAPLALKLGCGFAMVRKSGKLPGDVEEVHYDLEYGTDRMEVQKGIIPQGAKVVIVDDLLATGGTVAAAHKLLQKVGAEVTACGFLIELAELRGNQQLSGLPYEVLMKF